MEHLATTLVNNACPRCGQGELFKSFFVLHEKCDNCGAVYSRDPGAWTGPTVMSYMLALVLAFFLLIGMWLTDNLWPGSEFILAGFLMVVTLPCHRVMKAAWVGMLFDWGMVYPDPEPEPEPES